MTRVYPVSLGCPKNRVDTEKLLAELKARGAETVLDPAEADVLLVNTCAFIREAVEESLDVILELAEEKTPAQRLVVMGCLVSRYREELLAELPEVDLFLGIEAYRAPEAVLSPPARYLLRLEGPETPRRILTESPFFAYLKVTEGCRHACSFCTIPRIRGPLRSLPAPLLLEEARALLEEGVKELILVGQDVSAYGLDHGEPALVSLINELLNLEGLRWLRLLYLHPEGVRDELLELMAREPRICPYLDLPVQHASAKVLKAMRRPYDPERILRLLERLRK
ncbi:MAG: MiaB/RimO family radical SAM methylthiotransferase, partial [Thermodesulfobacteria bacterium]|nr:MiaB/RimO family radical SAM methylthiotransferase [Thermodesulfobacteriota bacterium]